jgi:hypothetical protein
MGHTSQEYTVHVASEKIKENHHTHTETHVYTHKHTDLNIQIYEYLCAGVGVGVGLFVPICTYIIRRYIIGLFPILKAYV